MGWVFLGGFGCENVVAGRVGSEPKKVAGEKESCWGKRELLRKKKVAGEISAT